MSNETTAIAGPWVAERSICEDSWDRGLAVIAVLPELARVPGATPTRGMIAWVASGLGACETDEQAIATARLIAIAPTMHDLLIRWLESDGDKGDIAALIAETREVVNQ